MASACTHCKSKDAEIVLLRAQNEELRAAVREFDKLCTLQQADLDRVGKERKALEPNRSERLSGEELQLVFEGIVTALGSPANDAATTALTDDAATPKNSADGSASPAASCEAPPPNAPNGGSEAVNPNEPKGGAEAEAKKKKGHGRRPIDLTKLPVQDVVVEPAEVTANPELYSFIGNECSERLAHREASFIRIRLVLRRSRELTHFRSRELTQPSATQRQRGERSGDDGGRCANARARCAAVGSRLTRA